MLVVVTLVITARFWIRLQLVNGRLGVEDWCILAAWALAAAFDLDPINRESFTGMPYKIAVKLIHPLCLTPSRPLNATVNEFTDSLP